MMESKTLKQHFIWLTFIFQVVTGIAHHKSCLDHYTIGQVYNNGYYIVFDSKDEPYRVYCDFTSEPNFVYTLITSWKFSNSMTIPFRYRGYNTNTPINEFNPNWESYRMSKQRMKEIRDLKGITHWRFTCNYDTMKRIDYRDYLRARFAKFDLLHHYGFACREVEYINVMGAGCQNCLTRFYQTSGHIFSVRGLESGKSCGTKFKDMHSKEFERIGNLWGAYWPGNYNSDFRCQQNRDSTTNLWFGGKVSLLKYSY